MGVQNRQAPLDVFVGRTAELARVAEVVARVEAGEPWPVAVEGDPGMGKTALARRCLAGAAGLRVLQARASLAEADLDFGIADQLFRTVGGALLTGGAGVSTSSFAVGARLLEVAGEQLATGPLAIVIDDLQWVDRKSAEALTFMLRRLTVDPVLAIMIYRRPGHQLDEPAQRMLASVENRLQLTLDGLTADEVASLATVLRPGSLNDDTVRELRRTGQRRLAVERLRRANSLFRALRAEPFTARTEAELAACHLPGNPAKKQSVLALTSRETEVAHLVGKGMSNPEIAAELFISRKAVEYHLGNIYAKCGLQGRQELRRFVEQRRQPYGATGSR